MHLTIEETEEGLLLCLHLLPSETSSELRAFASSRRGPSQLPPRLSSTVPLIGSRREEPSQPPSLDVGVGRVRSRPAREDIVAVLDRAIRAKTEPLGGAIGALSRGVGNLLSGTGIDPRAGVSISQQLAELTGKTVAEVHLGLAAPFFAETTSGGELGKALINDFRTLARDGNVPALERLIEQIEVTEDRLDTLVSAQSSPASSIGGGKAGVGGPELQLGRGILLIRSQRALKNLRELKRQADLNRKLAEVVQREP